MPPRPGVIHLARTWFARRVVVPASFFVLGRALSCAVRFHPAVTEEVRGWPEGLVLAMEVEPSGPRMGWHKRGSRLHYRGARVCDAQVTLRFKNLVSAVRVLTPQMSPARGFVEHRIGVVGDVGVVMSFNRCLDVVLTLLYPKFIHRRLVKRPTPLGPRGHLARWAVYLLGVPLGL